MPSDRELSRPATARASAGVLATLAVILCPAMSGSTGPGGLSGQAAACSMAPEPDPVPRRWQLDVEVGPLRVMRVADRSGHERAYLYLTYSVVNNSGQDLVFAPSFELATEEGEQSRSGRGVPQEVTEEILRRLESPLIEDQIRIADTLLQGRANMRLGLVVWPAPGECDEVAVYAAGFSGETKTIEFVNPDGAPTRVIFRKTLMLRYATPGHLNEATADPIELVERRWIMR